MKKREEMNRVGKKKLVALVSVVAIVMGLLAVAGPSAAADKVFHWKFQSHHTAGSVKNFSHIR